MKILSYLFTCLYVIGLILLVSSGEYHFLAGIALLFSLYASVCAIKDYYNPMLLGLMIIGYGIALFAVLPQLVAENSAKPARSGTIPIAEEMQFGIILILCLISNTLFMFTGFRKAKLPGYNKDFTVKEKKRSPEFGKQGA